MDIVWGLYINVAYIFDYMDHELYLQLFGNEEKLLCELYIFYPHFIISNYSYAHVFLFSSQWLYYVYVAIM